MAKRRKKQQRNRNNRWVMGLIGLGAVVIVAFIIISSRSMAGTPLPNTGAQPTLPAVFQQCGTPECGQPNAPVTIEIFADYQCPYCRQADGILLQFLPPYIQSGKVKLVYKNFPIIGQESYTAAQAALCAGDQNKYWAYGSYLFANQQSENSGTLTPDYLTNVAGQLGMDKTAFSACLNSGKYATQVNQDQADGQKRGVTATPTFFVNGKKYEGVLQPDQLTTIINGIAK